MTISDNIRVSLTGVVKKTRQIFSHLKLLMNVPDVRNAPANTIRFVNGVPGALVRTPGQVVNLGTGAFNTVGAVGSRVPAATGTAIQVTGQTLPVSSLLHSLFELSCLIILCISQ